MRSVPPRGRSWEKIEIAWGLPLDIRKSQVGKGGYHSTFGNRKLGRAVYPRLIRYS